MDDPLNLSQVSTSSNSSFKDVLDVTDRFSGSAHNPNKSLKYLSPCEYRAGTPWGRSAQKEKVIKILMVLFEESDYLFMTIPNPWINSREKVPLFSPVEFFTRLGSPFLFNPSFEANLFFRVHIF